MPEVTMTVKGSVEINLPIGMIESLDLDAQLPLEVVCKVTAKSRRRLRRSGEDRVLFEVQPVELRLVGEDGTTYIETEETPVVTPPSSSKTEDENPQGPRVVGSIKSSDPVLSAALKGPSSGDIKVG